MIEVPLNWIFINPAIDIFIFIFISYLFLFRYYKMLLDKNFKKISWIDLEVSIIFIALGYLNYSEITINIFNFKTDWFFTVIFIQLIIETIFIFIYWKYFKIYLEKIKKTSEIIEEENLEKTISELKTIQNLLEDDLNKYKIQGNKNSIDKMSSEVEKIEVEILKLQKKLRNLKKKKND